MNTMKLKRQGMLGLIAVVVAILGGSLAAHEVTHKGTAIALKAAKYAQPSGPAREVHELEVTVVDPKTKKSSNRVFTITDKTRVLRAGKPIKVGAAAVQKGEEVSVVVDHDKAGDEAIEVRLGTAK
jgi:hypothetical protein